MFEFDWRILRKDRMYGSLIDEILSLRGISAGDIFLDISEEALSDPYGLPGTEKAVDRISSALENEQKITIYGDYDADGLTSAAIMMKILRKAGADVHVFIPDRFDDGYGLSIQSLEKIINDGTELVITTDCGINSTAETDFLNSRGVDLIITDHHILSGSAPEASAVVHADKSDDSCIFRDLSGAGVALKVADALNMKLNITEDFREFYCLASIGTIADIVPLTGENRIIAGLGLRYLNEGVMCGINAILDISGKRNGIVDSYTVGFIIAPRLNAAGRMGSADRAFSILAGDDRTEAHEIAASLDSLNKARQELQNKVVEEIERNISSDPGILDCAVIVASVEGNFKGVVGIAASKISEKYLKPSIILSVSEGIAEGSGRSPHDFSLIDSLDFCSDILIK